MALLRRRHTDGGHPTHTRWASSSASVELYISSEAKLDWYDMKHKQNECGHFLCDVQVYEMMIYMCSERIYVEHAIDVDANVGWCGHPPHLPFVYSHVLPPNAREYLFIIAYPIRVHEHTKAYTRADKGFRIIEK